MLHKRVLSELPHILFSGTPLHNCWVPSIVTGASVDVDDIIEEDVDDEDDEDVEVTVEHIFCDQSHPAALHLLLLVYARHGSSDGATLSNGRGTVPVPVLELAVEDEEEAVADGWLASSPSTGLQTAL